MNMSDQNQSKKKQPPPSIFSPLAVGVACFFLMVCLALHILTIISFSAQRRPNEDYLYSKMTSIYRDRHDGRTTWTPAEPTEAPDSPTVVYTDDSRKACKFQKYPSVNYYHWTQPKKKSQASFMTESDYIYGDWPILLESASHPHKLCLDRREWYDYWYHRFGENDVSMKIRPFMDATYPGVVARTRLDLFGDTWWLARQGEAFWLGSNTAYIVTLSRPFRHCNVVNNTPPKQVATVLQMMDSSFRLLEQVTLSMERDAAWGNLPIAEQVSEALEGDAGYNYYYPREQPPELHDAQLFVYNQHLWIQYRGHDDSGFPPNSLLLNRVYMDADTIYPGGKFTRKLLAYFKASETQVFSAGGGETSQAIMVDAPVPPGKWIRAEFRGNTTLRVLAQVEPLAVETAIPEDSAVAAEEPVGTVVATSLTFPRNVPAPAPSQATWFRPPRLPEKIPSFHDTSSLLVHLPDREEYFGVGRLSRKPKLSSLASDNDTAITTHFFFILSDQSPYLMTHLSPEFVLPAAAGRGRRRDSEKIQRVTGLEVVETTDTPDDRLVLLAYSIQDCESAVTTILWKSVDSLMRPVPPFINGTFCQVRDMMAPLR